MSREIFEVTKDRFHLRNPCCYILQGTWPKEAKMRAMLDGSEIKSEIQRLEVVSALERFKDPDLMRGERITAAVQLPESLEGYQKLSVYADMPDKTFCWFSVAVKNLESAEANRSFLSKKKRFSRDSYVSADGQWQISRYVSRFLTKTKKRSRLKSFVQNVSMWSRCMRKWITRTRPDFLQS